MNNGRLVWGLVGLSLTTGAITSADASPLPARVACNSVTIGAWGSEVAAAQAKLGGLTVDGVFGPRTRARVIAFQRSHALVPDGIVGPLTWKALGVASCASTTPAPGTSSTRYVKAGISLNVRTGPSTAYTRVGSLSAGTPVTGTPAGSWVKITAGPNAGRYVSGAYLTTSKPSRTPGASTTPRPSTPTPPPAQPAGQVTAYVRAASGAAGAYANVRSAPSFTAPVMDTLGAHQQVTGTWDGAWLHTTTGGYVYRGTLTSANPSAINGHLPASSLCALPAAYNATHSFSGGTFTYTASTPRYLDCDAAAQFDQLEQAYKSRFGTYAPIDLAYRDYDEQNYWFTKLGWPVAALPGQSSHGVGIAVDFEEDDTPNTFSWGGQGHAWLRASAPKYGFVNPFTWGTPHESFHFSLAG